MVAVVPSPVQFTVISTLIWRSPLPRVASLPSIRLKLIVPDPLPVGMLSSSKLKVGDLKVPKLFAALIRF